LIPPEDRLNLILAHGGFVGILPLGNSRFRLFGAVPNSFAAKLRSDGDDTVPISLIQGWFDDYFDVDARIASAEWTSFYRIHRRGLLRGGVAITASFRKRDQKISAPRSHRMFRAGRTGRAVTTNESPPDMVRRWRVSASDSTRRMHVEA
jgi:hypothetical protein